MGFLFTQKRKKRSLSAQINKELKKLEIKKQKAKLASLRKQNRGY